MAYNGSTAASSIANPPRLVSSASLTVEHGSSALQGDGSTGFPINSPGGRGGNVWAYVSTDAVGTVIGSSYFTDGYKLGMRPGDFLLGVSHTTDGATLVRYFGAVLSVDSSAGGATVVAGGVASS